MKLLLKGCTWDRKSWKNCLFEAVAAPACTLFLLLFSRIRFCPSPVLCGQRSALLPCYKNNCPWHHTFFYKRTSHETWQVSMVCLYIFILTGKVLTTYSQTINKFHNKSLWVRSPDREKIILNSRWRLNKITKEGLAPIASRPTYFLVSHNL
jgi:hypothetical protein